MSILINRIIIPDNATNGDIFEALFDVKEVRKYRTRVTAWTLFDGIIVPIDSQLNWWNAPYKKGEKNEYIVNILYSFISRIYCT